MKPIRSRHAPLLALSVVPVLLTAGCATAVHPGPTRADAAEVPAAAAFTSSPLRNRIRVHLEADVATVWALVGDHTRLPEYSAGLERVEASATGDERICHFRPAAPDEGSSSLREEVRWYAAGTGYATSAEEPNAFGITGDLTLVLVQPTAGGTAFTWEQHYDAEDLPAMKTAFDQALSDIAEQLVGRFGGRITERFVEGA
ncbi:SRPBCC family protein [Vulgatibacter sp.]|uniref:SRPBCC family protein n=1 Tax=Vulgatibacter sp. TaxID=1971226 RepID=UPI003569F5B7